MFKTYRIIPFVFILFLFGLTLIPVSTIFAQDSPGIVECKQIKGDLKGKKNCFKNLARELQADVDKAVKDLEKLQADLDSAAKDKETLQAAVDEAKAEKGVPKEDVVQLAIDINRAAGHEYSKAYMRKGNNAFNQIKDDFDSVNSEYKILVQKQENHDLELREYAKYPGYIKGVCSENPKSAKNADGEFDEKWAPLHHEVEVMCHEMFE